MYACRFSPRRRKRCGTRHAATDVIRGSGVDARRRLGIPKRGVCDGGQAGTAGAGDETDRERPRPYVGAAARRLADLGEDPGAEDDAEDDAEAGSAGVDLSVRLAGLDRSTATRFGGARSERRRSHGDDDVSSGVTLFEIPDRRWDLVRQIHPVDHRRDLARLHEVREELQVISASFRDAGAEPLSTNGDNMTALMMRSTGPSQRPLDSPLPRTSVPLVVARRQSDSDRVPASWKSRVVALPRSREVLLGAVDDLVGADRSDHVQVPRSAHAGHFRSERFARRSGWPVSVPTNPPGRIRTRRSFRSRRR